MSMRRSSILLRSFVPRSSGCISRYASAAAVEAEQGVGGVEDAPDLPPPNSQDKEVSNKLGKLIASSRRSEVPLSKLLESYTGPFTVNGLSRALYGAKEPSLAKELLDWGSQQPGFDFNSALMCSVLRGLASGGHLDEGRKLVLEEFKDRFEPTDYVYNRLVRHYVAKADSKGAKELLEEMRERGLALDKASNRSLFMLQFEESGLEGFMSLFQQRIDEGWVPIQEVCDFGVKRLCADKKVVEAFEFFKLCKSKGCQPEDHTYHTLMKQLSADGNLEEAFEVTKMLLELPEFKCESPPFKTVINKLAVNGRLEQACELFHLVKDKGTVPPGLQLVSALSKAGKFGVAMEIVEAHGCSTHNDLAAHKYLILALCREGMLDEAKKMFECLLEKGGSPDAETCNMLVEATAKTLPHGDPRRKKFIRGEENPCATGKQEEFAFGQEQGRASEEVQDKGEGERDKGEAKNKQ